MMTEPDAPSPALKILVWAQRRCAQDLQYALEELAMIESLSSGSSCTVEVHVDEPWNKLPGVLSAIRPDVFHFIGHGKRGALIALDSDAASSIDECEIPPERVAWALRNAGTSPRGIFLNGCDTAHWAPHFIPRGGWVIGSTHKMSDDVGAFFAPQFYQYLIAGDTDSNAFDKALDDVMQLSGGTVPPLVRWVEDLDPEDFLHKVFNREAFRSTVRQEGSLYDLADALKDVRTALATSALATRVDFVEPSPTVYCREPLEKNLVRRLSHRLECVTADLRSLKREFPDEVRYIDGWTTVDFGQRERLDYLARRIDDSRNQLLTEVNAGLPAQKQLRLIG